MPFDPEKQIAVIKCSICNGEQLAGFKSKEDGHFTEVMLIKDDRDLAKFKEIYKLTEIKKEY
ncbi:MAG: aspartate dehydrogenase [Eubacterium sp.]|nr:aspartate dehydrogenase [Eubacterium sp.]